MKIRLLLNLLKKEYTEVPLSDMSADIPLGKVPVLRHPSGIVSESMAILYFLAQGTIYMPEKLVELLQWLSFEQSEIQNSIGCARYIIREKIADSKLKTYQYNAHRAIKILDAHLKDRPFIIDHFSIADIALYPYLFLAEEANINTRDYEHVTIWLARLTNIFTFSTR